MLIRTVLRTKCFALFLSLFLSVLGQISYAKDKNFDFVDICVDTQTTLAEKINALRENGWRKANYSEWKPFRLMLEEAFLAISITANANKQKWNKAIIDATTLIEYASFSKAERTARNLVNFDPVIMTRTGNNSAALIIFDESIVVRGKTRCIYGGSKSSELTELMAQFQKSENARMSDSYIQQYSIDVLQPSSSASMLFSALKPESIARMGKPPINEISVSIYTQPRSQ